MLLGHTSYYFNSLWKQFDPFNPLFPSWTQFALRYAGYLCAPGFLMMAGAMVWWSFQKRFEKVNSSWAAQWHFIQRGLFLVAVQMTWVNSSWGGFNQFQPFHLGIIACIGISVILLTLIVNTSWYIRLSIGVLVLLVHPFLVTIPYDSNIMWQQVLMQTFVDAGSFNKYPVLPWFGLAVLGSVMATGWLKIWQTNRKRILMGLLIASLSIGLAFIIRLSEGFGSVFTFSKFFSVSFFVDQKYPPTLFMNLLFFGLVVLGVTSFIAIGWALPSLLKVFSVPGKTPLFFYGMHIAILGVFTRIFPTLYRSGNEITALVGFAILLMIMLPLCNWFYRVKRRSSNYFIQLI